MKEIEDRISELSTIFEHTLWPIVKRYVGGGRVLVTEVHAGDSMRAALDVCAGIDAFQVNDTGVRAIASRIQQGRDYRSYTIRTRSRGGNETEIDKRTRATQSNDGYMYPHLTIQAYMSAGYTLPVLSIGIVRTRDLYHALSLRDWPRRRNSDGSEFVFLHWDELTESGIKVVQIAGDACA